MNNLSKAKSKNDDKNGQWMQGAVEHPEAFTEWCGGKVTDECIERGKKSKDPHVVKMATLAETFRRYAKKKKDFEAVETDFSTYYGRITRAGPFQYPEGIRYKLYPNLKEVFQKTDHLPVYSSHRDKEDELVGFGYNWIFNDDKKDIFGDIAYFKDIRELSALKNPEELPVSIKFNDVSKTKVQKLEDLISIAVSLNKEDLDRCSSVSGYESCTVSTKKTDFSDSNDSPPDSELLGSDGTRYDSNHTTPEGNESSIKNKKEITTQVKTDMGDNDAPEERTEEDTEEEEEITEELPKISQGDFDKLKKENEELKAQLGAYEDFEETFVKQMKELEDFKEKMVKKETKRKEKKLAALREDLIKAPYNACKDFVTAHDYEFLKDFKRGLDGVEVIKNQKKPAEEEDFVPSLADFGKSVEDLTKKYEKWVIE